MMVILQYSIGNMKIGKFNSGWWLISTPLKKIKVSWDDEISNMWESYKCSKAIKRGKIMGAEYHSEFTSINLA